MSDWAEEFDVVVFGFGGVEHHAAGNASIVCDYRTGRLPRMPSHTVFDEHTSRSGNQRSGTTLARGTGSPCWQRAEYRRRMLVELEAPDPQMNPDLAAAIDYYCQAQQRYAEG
jgi:hypothetical protein